MYIFLYHKMCLTMGLLRDTQNCGLRMRRECLERFPRLRLVSDPGMHHGMCVKRHAKQQPIPNSLINYWNVPHDI